MEVNRDKIFRKKRTISNVKYGKRSRCLGLERIKFDDYVEF
jgi:hypothetical protein